MQKTKNSQKILIKSSRLEIVGGVIEFFAPRLACANAVNYCCRPGPENTKLR